MRKISIGENKEIIGGKNIIYSTDAIAKYYTFHRIKWDDFYLSERWIFERVAGAKRSLGRVLDVGCAVGGLGCALLEQFSVAEYVGIDINRQAIEIAKSGKSSYPIGRCHFMCGDILEMETLPAEGFDNVFSLSCADWNIRTRDIINGCWRYVVKGGHFVLTLRLTSEDSLSDIEKSHQYICFEDEAVECMEGFERAPYVVFNANEAITMLNRLDPKPARIIAYGYYGKPSPSARTMYDRLCFTALAVRKGGDEDQHPETLGEFHLPVDLLF